MGEYGRQFMEYMITISAPTFGTHLDLVALVFVAIVIAALVIALMIRMTGIHFYHSDLPIGRSFAPAPRQLELNIGDEARARAPTAQTA